MKESDDYFNLRNFYGYTEQDMMTREKDAIWSQALQSLVMKDNSRQFVQTTQSYHQPATNTNTFISLQEVPRGITVYQPVMSPVMNTGIVVDFANGGNTSMANSFAATTQPVPQAPSIQQPNRFDPQQNGYNQIIQTRVAQPSPNGYGNYGPPPSYASYLQGSQNPANLNNNQPLGTTQNINNQTLTVIHGGQLINNVSTQPTLGTMLAPNHQAAMYNTSQQHQPQHIVTQNMQLNSPPLLVPNNQAVSVNNTRVINLPNFTSNGMTITRSTVTPTNSQVTQQPTNGGAGTNIYRKEGNIITPTLSQLLDRGVQPPKNNLQEHPKLVQMLKNPEMNFTHSTVVQNRPVSSPVVQNRALPTPVVQNRPVPTPLVQNSAVSSTAVFQNRPVTVTTTPVTIPITLQNITLTPIVDKPNSPLVQLLNAPQKTVASEQQKTISITTTATSREEERVMFVIPDNQTSQADAGKPKPPETKPDQPAPPRKARVKISPKLGNDAKRRMWYSHFEPNEEKIEEEPTKKLPEPDENGKWDMTKFKKCYVKVTKLPPEIEDIYFAKGNYKKRSKEALVYVGPSHKKTVRFKPYVAIKQEQEIPTDATSQMDVKETVNQDEPMKQDAPLKTILKIKKIKNKNEAYKVMETNNGDQELKTTLKTIKKYKIKRSNRRSEKAKCTFCNKMRKPADNWRHVMAIYSKNVDAKDQISADQVKEECELCGTKVCSKSALKAHQENVHDKSEETEELPFECFVCKRRLKSEEFLEFHLQTHFRSKKKSSGKASKVKKDEEEGGEKEDAGTNEQKKSATHQCDFCQRSFQTGCALAAHLKVHGIFPDNKCSICSKVFVKPSQLKAHLVVHTDERPFECTECDKTFRFRSSLKQHSYSHQGILPYKCKICSKAFVANWSLSHHMKRTHKTSHEMCRVCKQTFTDKLSLSTHMKLYHGKKSPTKGEKEESAIEEIAETLLKQLAHEDDDDAMTETEDPMNEEEDGAIDRDDLDGLESNMELVCELCDNVSTSIADMEKHLMQYHRVKESKVSKLLPV